MPYVLGVKPSTDIWAPIDAIHSPRVAVQELHGERAQKPGGWTPIVRSFRDGRTEIWWWAAAYRPCGPDQRRRMTVTTTDPATLPKASTSYLAANRTHPGRADGRAINRCLRI